MTAFLRILLLPFSLIYFFIVLLRNFFYEINLLKSYKLSKPVISTGNISTGGTGKSPFTLILAEHLLKNGFKPAIISRGYKRESDDIEIAFDGNTIKGSIEKCGDEPVMMANRLSAFYKDFFILTGSNRVRTAEFAIDKFNPDVILLDDAFQHRKIKRDLDIVLIDSTDYIKKRFKNSFLLPAGNLRENIGNLKRADILVLNDKFEIPFTQNYFDKFGKDIFRLTYEIIGFYDNDMNKTDISGKDVVAFAGIAGPESFFNKIKACNCKSIKTIAFKDHHRYSADDIKQITDKVSKETVFISTEKDFIKIREFDDFLKYFCVLFMKIELNLNEENKFFCIIDNLIKDYRN